MSLSSKAKSTEVQQVPTKQRRRKDTVENSATVVTTPTITTTTTTTTTLTAASSSTTSTSSSAAAANSTNKSVASISVAELIPRGQPVSGCNWKAPNTTRFIHKNKRFDFACFFRFRLLIQLNSLFRIINLL